MTMRYLLVILLVITLSGCASTRKSKSSSDNLQTRLGDMERRVEEKDAEIESLKDDIRDLNQQIANVPSSTPAPQIIYEPAPARPTTSSRKSIDKSDQRIIRVSASPEEVQMALKNAGFYEGTVDGKVGEKTKKAIKAFQEANGLTTDGLIGTRTWAKLKTYLN